MHEVTVNLDQHSIEQAAGIIALTRQEVQHTGENASLRIIGTRKQIQAVKAVLLAMGAVEVKKSKQSA